MPHSTFRYDHQHRRDRAKVDMQTLVARPQADLSFRVVICGDDDRDYRQQRQFRAGRPGVVLTASEGQRYWDHLLAGKDPQEWLDRHAQRSSAREEALDAL